VAGRQHAPGRLVWPRQPARLHPRRRRHAHEQPEHGRRHRVRHQLHAGPELGHDGEPGRLHHAVAHAVEAPRHLLRPRRPARLPARRLPLRLAVGAQRLRPAEHVHGGLPLQRHGRDGHRSAREGPAARLLRRRQLQVRQRRQADDRVESAHRQQHPDWAGPEPCIWC